MKKVNLQEFANEFNTFCESDKRNLVIRGFDNKDKFLAVLLMLKNKQVKEALLETYGVQNLQSLFERYNFKKDMVHIGKTGNVYGIKLLFGKYTITDNLYANNEYAIFYPVQSVLDEPKDLKKLAYKVECLRTKHNIFITTNDYNNKVDKLYNYVDVDETLILDLSEKYPEEYRTIKDNLQREGKELPY